MVRFCFVPPRMSTSVRTLHSFVPPPQAEYRVVALRSEMQICSLVPPTSGVPRGGTAFGNKKTPAGIFLFPLLCPH